MFKYIPEREESKVESILWLGFWQQQTKFTITIIPISQTSFIYNTTERRVSFILSTKKVHSRMQEELFV